MTQLVEMLDDLDTAITPGEILKIESRLFDRESQIEYQLAGIRLEMLCNEILLSLTPLI